MLFLKANAKVLANSNIHTKYDFSHTATEVRMYSHSNLNNF